MSERLLQHKPHVSAALQLVDFVKLNGQELSPPPCQAFLGCSQRRRLPSPHEFSSPQEQVPQHLVISQPRPACRADWAREDIRSRLEKSNLCFGESGIGIENQPAGRSVRNDLDPNRHKLESLRGALSALDGHRELEGQLLERGRIKRPCRDRRRSRSTSWGHDLVSVLASGPFAGPVTPASCDASQRPSSKCPCGYLACVSLLFAPHAHEPEMPWDLKLPEDQGQSLHRCSPWPHSAGLNPTLLCRTVLTEYCLPVGETEITPLDPPDGHMPQEAK